MFASHGGRFANLGALDELLGEVDEYSAAPFVNLGEVDESCASRFVNLGKVDEYSAAPFVTLDAHDELVGFVGEVRTERFAPRAAIRGRSL